MRAAALNPKNRRQHSWEILGTHFGTLKAKDYFWYKRYLKEYLSCMPLGARALPSWRSPRLMPIQTKILQTNSLGFAGYFGYFMIFQYFVTFVLFLNSESCCQTVRYSKVWLKFNPSTPKGMTLAVQLPANLCSQIIS